MCSLCARGLLGTASTASVQRRLRYSEMDLFFMMLPVTIGELLEVINYRAAQCHDKYGRFWYISRTLCAFCDGDTGIMLFMEIQEGAVLTFRDLHVLPSTLLIWVLSIFIIDTVKAC